MNKQLQRRLVLHAYSDDIILLPVPWLWFNVILFEPQEDVTESTLEIERIRGNPSMLQSMTVKELRELTRFTLFLACPYFVLPRIVFFHLIIVCHGLEGGWGFLGKVTRKTWYQL
jgi:hypothetical protein